MNAPAPSSGKSRKRGLIYLLIGLLLLIGSLVMFTTCQPAVGEHYSTMTRLMIYAATGAGWWLFLMGLYYVIAGPTVGGLRTVAIVVVCVLGLVALGESWLAHAALSLRRVESSHHHHDFD